MPPRGSVWRSPDRGGGRGYDREGRGGEGRMCLPPMLLHPVKDVELPVEQSLQEVDVPESDPAA